MNKYSRWLILASLVVMACGNSISGKPDQPISSDSGNGQQVPLPNQGRCQQVPLPNSGNGQLLPLPDGGNVGKQSQPDGGNGRQLPVPDEAKSSLAYDPNPVVSHDTELAVVLDQNNFGLAVFQALAPTNQNFGVSPISGFIPLTMTSAGAIGTTAAQMKAVLYPDVSLSDIQAATNQLVQRVKACALPSAQTNVRKSGHREQTKRSIVNRQNGAS